VQVEVQDLVLVEVLLDPHGEHHVLDLADVGPVRRQEERLRDLLGDGAPALLDAAGAQVGPGGAGDSREVEPGVRVERVVLRRDEGLDQELRDHLDGHDLAALSRELADHLAVGRVDARDQVRPVVVERVELREVPEDQGVEEPDTHRADENGQEAEREQQLSETSQSKHDPRGGEPPTSNLAQARSPFKRLTRLYPGCGTAEIPIGIKQLRRMRRLTPDGVEPSIGCGATRLHRRPAGLAQCRSGHDNRVHARSAAPRA
jgi:hypothetical protein